MANKTVDGNQITVVSHVNDLRISHENQDTVNALINKLSERYGKGVDLTIHRGKVHEYLGMKLDYRKEGKVKINITDYLKKILNNLSSKYQGRAITPAENLIFEVIKTMRKLSKKEAQAFHTIVAKLIFLCKQARPDILTGVAFLTTRVREPDKDNYKKISRILKYLSGTRDIILTLESDGTRRVKWWVDTEFTVHHDMKSHTGRMVY